MSIALHNIIRLQKSTKNSVLSLRELELENPEKKEINDLIVIYWKKKKNLLMDTKKITYLYLIGSEVECISNISDTITRIIEIQKAKIIDDFNSYDIEKIIFSINDSINCIDLRLEFNVPGLFSAFIFNQKSHVLTLNDLEWDYFYISSVLRSINPKHAEDCHYENYLYSQANLEKFLGHLENVFKTFYKSKGSTNKNNLSFDIQDQPGVNTSLTKVQANTILTKLYAFIVDYNRLQLGINFFLKMAEFDPYNFIYLTKIYMHACTTTKGITILASILKFSQKNTYLLYYESKLLANTSRNTQALILLQQIIGLQIDFMEAWLLIIEIFIQQKNYVDALFCINNFLYLANSKERKITKPKKIQKINPPKHLEKSINTSCLNACCLYYGDANSSDFYYYNCEDKFVDAKDHSFNALKKKIEKFHQLSANSLVNYYKKIYKLLVTVEKNIGLQQLILLRNELFFSEVNPDKLDEKQKEKRKDVFENLIPKIYSLVSSIKQLGKYEKNNNEINFTENQNTVTEAEASIFVTSMMLLEDDRSFEFEKNMQQSTSYANKSTNKDSALISPTYNYKKRSNTNNNDIEGIKNTKKELLLLKNAYFEIVDKEFTEKTARVTHHNKIIKRNSSILFDDLLIILCEDLYEFYLDLHDHLEIHKGLKENNYLNIYNEMMLIESGYLSIRLCRPEFAENYFLQALNSGFSPRAIIKLLNYYLHTNNLLSFIATINKTMKLFWSLGYTDIKLPPLWIIKYINKLISKLGLENFEKYCESAQVFLDSTIQNLLNETTNCPQINLHLKQYIKNKQQLFF